MFITCFEFEFTFCDKNKDVSTVIFQFLGLRMHACLALVSMRNLLAISEYNYKAHFRCISHIKA